MLFGTKFNLKKDHVSLHWPVFSTGFLLKGYSEILWSGVQFSSHILILLYILKELPYTNLTSIGLFQKQNGFDKIGRFVHFLNLYVRT